jgi:hypothetical protein
MVFLHPTLDELIDVLPASGDRRKNKGQDYNKGARTIHGASSVTETAQPFRISA